MPAKSFVYCGSKAAKLASVCLHLCVQMMPWLSLATTTSSRLPPRYPPRPRSSKPQLRPRTALDAAATA